MAKPLEQNAMFRSAIEAGVVHQLALENYIAALDATACVLRFGEETVRRLSLLPGLQQDDKANLAFLAEIAGAVTSELDKALTSVSQNLEDLRMLHNQGRRQDAQVCYQLISTLLGVLEQRIPQVEGQVESLMDQAAAIIQATQGSAAVVAGDLPKFGSDKS